MNEWTEAILEKLELLYAQRKAYVEFLEEHGIWDGDVLLSNIDSLIADVRDELEWLKEKDMVEGDSG